MLDSLITSKTRIKLLLKLFLNPETKGYLRGLAEEFGESTNAVRVELNRLTEAGLLESATEGRTKLYHANTKHSLFSDLQNIVKKFVGIDQIIENIVDKLGEVKIALIIGDYARGIDSGIIDLVIVGNIDQTYLHTLVAKSEALIKRRVRTLIYTEQEFESDRKTLLTKPAMVVWEKEHNNG